METKIITISREYASGGGSIGKMTAKKLDIPCYDTEIIKETMKKTGISEAMIESAEQRVTSSFLFNLAMGVAAERNYMEQIYQAEKEIILEKVSQGPCVIVGRAANFIKKNEIASINAFIYSDLKHRMEYAVRNLNVDEKNVRAVIEKSDKERSLFSRSYYDREWGEKSNYDIMLNTGILGMEKSSDILVNLYENWQ